MNCKKCGHEMGLEGLICPNCGIEYKLRTQDEKDNYAKIIIKKTVQKQFKSPLFLLNNIFLCIAAACGVFLLFARIGFNEDYAIYSLASTLIQAAFLVFIGFTLFMSWKMYVGKNLSRDDIYSLKRFPFFIKIMSIVLPILAAVASIMATGYFNAILGANIETLYYPDFEELLFNYAIISDQGFNVISAFQLIGLVCVILCNIFASNGLEKGLERISDTYLSGRYRQILNKTQITIWIIGIVLFVTGVGSVLLAGLAMISEVLPEGIFDIGLVKSINMLFSGLMCIGYGGYYIFNVLILKKIDEKLAQSINAIYR